MGRIARVLSFLRTARNGAKISDVKADPGGGPNISGEHFAPAGDDSYPLPSDYAVFVPIEQTGREVAGGYLDPNSSQKATAGEKRIYSRNSTGAESAEIWLKSDGTILLDNGSVSLTLSPDGSAMLTNSAGTIALAATGIISLNGATVDVSGNIVSPGTITGVTVNGTTVAAVSALTVAGQEMGGHYHTQGPDSPSGDTQQNTSTPVGP